MVPRLRKGLAAGDGRWLRQYIFWKRTLKLHRVGGSFCVLFDGFSGAIIIEVFLLAVYLATPERRHLKELGRSWTCELSFLNYQ